VEWVATVVAAVPAVMPVLAAVAPVAAADVEAAQALPIDFAPTLPESQLYSLYKLFEDAVRSPSEEAELQDDAFDSLRWPIDDGVPPAPWLKFTESGGGGGSRSPKLTGCNVSLL